MTKLTSLLNIGKAIEAKLESVDITTAEELKSIGSREAFVRLKTQYPNICIVYLYSLEGAVTNNEYNQLSDDVKLSLKEFNDNLTK